MRITCPNCGAQYEVADDVIPSAGRDVQCSACGHTWLQRPPGATSVVQDGAGPGAPVPPTAAAPAAAAAPPAVPPPAEPTPAAAPPAEPEPEPEPEIEAEPEPESEPEPEPGPEPEPEREANLAPAGVGPEEISEQQAPPRPGLSPEIAAILRAEAEREKAVRAAERAGTIETQPDLGLEAHVDPEVQRAEEARRRMARLKGEAAPPTTAPVRPPGEPPRARERLPDIEEINSTLRAASERAPTSVSAMAAAAAEAPARGRGFRLGFSVVLLIAAAATLVYAMAPRISAAVPQAAGLIEAYVAAVDEARLWLDLTVQGLMPADPVAPDAVPDTAPPPAATTEAPAAPAAPAE